MARSHIYFKSLELLYDSWTEEALARQVTFMPCLIALIKTEKFEEAMNFVDRISSITGNPFKSRRKYLVLNAPYINEALMQNKSGNINVHIISEGVTGLLRYGLTRLKENDDLNLQISHLLPHSAPHWARDTQL